MLKDRMPESSILRTELVNHACVLSLSHLSFQCQDTMVQFITFLSLQLSLEEFTQRLPHMEELMFKYHSSADVSFALWRTNFSSAIYVSSTGEEPLDHCWSNNNKGSYTARTCPMKVCFFSKWRIDQYIILGLAKTLQPKLADELLMLYIRCNLLYMLYGTHTRSTYDLPSTGTTKLTWLHLPTWVFRLLTLYISLVTRVLFSLNTNTFVVYSQAYPL